MKNILFSVFFFKSLENIYIVNEVKIIKDKLPIVTNDLSISAYIGRDVNHVEGCKISLVSSVLVHAHGCVRTYVRGFIYSHYLELIHIGLIAKTQMPFCISVMAQTPSKITKENSRPTPDFLLGG